MTFALVFGLWRYFCLPALVQQNIKVFMFKDFYVMGKALTGEQSCTQKEITAPID